MLNMKKILIAGTVLTALCASAFAADTTAENVKPSMKARVNAILHDEACPIHGEGCDLRHTGLYRGRRGPQLTEEQVKQRQEMREKWEKMTPEQRQEARAKWREGAEKRRAERKEAAMAKLTDAQKAEVENFIKEDREERQERREKLGKMTPEQRQAIRAAEGRRFGHHRGHGYHKGYGYHHNQGLRDGSGPNPDCPVKTAE